jgi:hypothetical protein
MGDIHILGARVSRVQGAQAYRVQGAQACRPQAAIRPIFFSPD